MQNGLTGSSGPVVIELPQDRVGTFEPQIVKKRQRRLTGATPASAFRLTGSGT